MTRTQIETHIKLLQSSKSRNKIIVNNLINDYQRKLVKIKKLESKKPFTGDVILKPVEVKEKVRVKRPGKIKYKGTYKLGKKWAAYIYLHGKKTHLGTFNTAFLANKEYLRVKAGGKPRVFIPRNLKGTLNTGNRWRAQVFVNNKTTYLGSFDTELEAHKEYLRVKEGGAIKKTNI